MDNTHAAAPLYDVKGIIVQPDKCSGPTVQEVHIDFLLEEEFSVDLKFLRRFIEAAGQQGAPLQVEYVRHSVSDNYGEADLIVVYQEEGSGDRVAILIEDKIGACFQPCQAERYIKRGDSGMGTKWKRYWTCLVAPKSYADSKSEHGFHGLVTLEQIKEWIADTELKRREFKLRVIDKAIKTKVGVQVVDEDMTTFRKRYYALFEEFFADRRKDVRMRVPVATWRGDSWFEIRSDQFLPPGAYINHKAPWGFVDLTFPNTTAALLTSACLEADMQIKQTGKSAAIRLVVHEIDKFSDFDAERAKVEEALSAVRKLLDFYTRTRDGLQPALQKAKAASLL